MTKAFFVTFALFLIILGPIMLLKTEVAKLQEDIRTVNLEIKEDKKAVHVLKAEWAHLNSPERIRLLAEKHLGMQTISSAQVKGYDVLDPAGAKYKKVTYDR